MFRPISSPQRRIKIFPQKICQQQKIKTKDHLHLHLTVYIRNSYVCICRFISKNSRIAHFNSALLFINADCTQPAHFYIFSTRKVLEDRGICLMFTKNNITANKINNKNSKNAISCILPRKPGCANRKASGRKLLFRRFAPGRAEKCCLSAS